MPVEVQQGAGAKRIHRNARSIPPASRDGWYVCCIVDSRGLTIGSFHLQAQGGEVIATVTRREVAHHLETRGVRGVPPIQYILIPTATDLCTIGPEVEVRIVQPPEVTHV